MATFAVLIFLVSLGGLLVGMVKPALLEKVFKDQNITRKKAILGFGSLLIASIFMINLSSTDAQPQPEPQKQTAPSTITTTTPVSSTPATKQTSPSIGDEAYLRLPDNNDSNQKILLATDKSYYDEVLKTLMAKDYAGILELSNKGKAFGVSNGTKVLVIDNALGIRKVRIVKGISQADEDKVNLAGWVATEWVVKQ